MKKDVKKNLKKVGEKIKKMRKSWGKFEEKNCKKVFKKIVKKLEKSWVKKWKKSWKKLDNVFIFFFSAHHSHQMSEGAQMSKVTLCVKILKWQSFTQGRYRAARAAKNHYLVRACSQWTRRHPSPVKPWTNPPTPTIVRRFLLLIGGRPSSLRANVSGTSSSTSTLPRSLAESSTPLILPTSLGSMTWMERCPATYLH